MVVSDLKTMEKSDTKKLAVVSETRSAAIQELADEADIDYYDLSIEELDAHIFGRQMGMTESPFKAVLIDNCILKKEYCSETLQTAL